MIEMIDRIMTGILNIILIFTMTTLFVLLHQAELLIPLALAVWVFIKVNED